MYNINIMRENFQKKFQVKVKDIKEKYLDYQKRNNCKNMKIFKDLFIFIFFQKDN